MKTAAIVIIGFVAFLVLIGFVVMGVSWLMVGKEGEKSREDAFIVYIGENHD